MDYEFTLDEYGQPLAKFSMGHEVIGRWLTEELGDSELKINQLLAVIERIESREINRHAVQGSDFELRIERDEIEVTSHNLSEDEDGVPEDTSVYNAESVGGCGLADFKRALRAWWVFVGG